MKRLAKVTTYLICLSSALCFTSLFQSCVENLDNELPTIKEELIGEYLQNNPDRFSLFARMLDTTGVMGLLNAYGLYTVFVPTDDAVEDYISSLVDEDGNQLTSISQIPIADIKLFCYNHIIKGDTLLSEKFNEGALGIQSMSQHFISISHSDTSRNVYVNGKSLIIERDIKRHNGIVHIISTVLAPARVKIGEILEGDTLFSIYGKALKLTGLSEMMNLAPIEDESFDPAADTRALNDGYSNSVGEERPKSRKYGYTILGVSDDNLKNYKTCPACPNGVTSLNDLEAVAYYYYAEVFDHDADDISKTYSDDGVMTIPPDYDPTNKKNYLNRFMSYHCLDRILLNSRFIKDFFTPHHYDQYPMYDYVETMLENTLLEVLIDRQGKVLDNARWTNVNSKYGVFNFGDPVQGALLTDVQNKPDGGSLNGYYHGITKPILYSKDYLNDLITKRLRIDAASFFPEFSSNNMRGSNPTATAGVVGVTHCFLMPHGYLDGFEESLNTRLTYLAAISTWEDYQGDELWVHGSYNFTITTSAIPAGTYEVRMGYQATTNRGIAQLYWDSLPCGIPLNLSLLATDAGIGYETPGTNAEDVDGFENDKMMHNRGYMKGSCTYGAFVHSSYSAETARLSSQCLRRVLGTFTFTETKKHFLTVIKLDDATGREFMLDYLEFCPIELLETEGID